MLLSYGMNLFVCVDFICDKDFNCYKRHLKCKGVIYINI